MNRQLRITQTRSTVGKYENQERTLRALGLKRIRDTVVQADTPSVRGMITKVKHLVAVEEAKGE